LATKERKLFAQLKDKVDAVAFTNGTEPNIDLSFFWVTGIPNGIFEGGVAIATPRTVEVISSELEELSARTSGVRTTVYRTMKQREELVRKRFSRFDRIGVNSEELTYANYKFFRKCAGKTKLIDVSESIEKARVIKSEDEISRIQKACDITSKTAKAIPEFISEGMTETAAAAELNYMMMKLGATTTAFTTNASFGPATAEPHYTPAGRRLGKGQLALFDFGAQYMRYAADLTRTFVCSKPNAKQIEMHRVVLEAQLAAIDAIHGGAHGKEVDAAARDIVERSTFKGKFIHGTGHGLGVSVHDPGGIRMSKDMILEPGMVMTVEPGVYISGFGGVRIEDDVLVTKEGCRVMTRAPKELIRL
jgi:Xaa-Pro dipeptidase